MNKEEKSSNKCPICGRLTHKESKFCIFHASAEKKTEEEFKKALKEYVNKIKKEGHDYNFEGFIFIGNMDFKNDLNITVFKNVCFERATFEEVAFFERATFKGDADFIGATFKSDAFFGGATFKGDADFIGATFKTNADFEGTTFKRNAIFEGTTFKRKAIFGGATFEGSADFGTVFGAATFKGDADFIGATFKRNADFEGTTFEGSADFELEYLAKDLILNEAKVFPGKRWSINVNNGKGNISFQRTYLENTYLKIGLAEGLLIDFTDTLLRNTILQREQIENHILHEAKEEYLKANKIFLLLKNNFHSLGQYEDESWAFKKEKDMERLSKSFPYYKEVLKEEGLKEKFPILKWIRKGKFRKWITSVFSNMIYGYGERPWNVIKAALVVILLFAIGFSIIGIGNPEIIELKGTAINQNTGNIVDLASKGLLKNNVIKNFPDSLYFSLITFTTLGYGDFRPLEGVGRILAGSEAFIGAFMMALFVYTFARRTGGR